MTLSNAAPCKSCGHASIHDPVHGCGEMSYHMFAPGEWEEDGWCGCNRRKDWTWRGFRRFVSWWWRCRVSPIFTSPKSDEELPF